MATTPIYNWPTPDNTDLVKNGALSIRTLGNSIDTTMGTMTPKTLVDAKGDLIAASANDTPARLAVGANGETLVADSSTSTGLTYSAGSTRGNPVINSGMDIWQRGTSVAASGSQFAPDRWNSYRGGFAAGITVSRQATADTTNLPFIQYCARVQRDSGNAATNALNFTYNFENVDSTQFIGKTVTLSFYARKGANYSATSSNLSVQLQTGTGTDQTARGGFSGAAQPINENAVLTTTWQRFTYTGTLATSALQMGIVFLFNPTGTAGAADYYEITGVQIDLSSTALPYRRYSATIQGELAACQRYFNRLVSGTQNAVTTAQAIGTTGALGTRSYPQMRTGATITVSSASHFSLRSATNSALTATGFNYFNSGTQSATIYFDVASGLVAGNATEMYSSNASATLDLSAEL